MKIILVLLVFLTSFFASSAKAEEPQTLPHADFSELQMEGMAQVIQIIDPQTIQLDDGRIMQLAGLDFPDLSIHSSGDFALLAQEILQDMLVEKTVNIYQTQGQDWGRQNRMGHQIAQLERKDDGAWVEGALLALGLARVMTGQRNPEMAAQMYALEQEARAEKTGIWSNGAYAVLTPEETEEHQDSFQIVEGKVISAALKNNRLYLNFGADWKSDFTASIAPENKRLFLKQGLDPLAWNGKTIRVRGWIRSYNGPYMEIDHPEAVEIPSKNIDTDP